MCVWMSPNWFDLDRCCSADKIELVRSRSVVQCEQAFNPQWRGHNRDIAAGIYQIRYCIAFSIKIYNLKKNLRSPLL